ncbi:gamma-gliadin-like [Panicum virgatum]|uniref:gamma-gliadin-like n=1 Tax=Panicum virgatum TaxID=38727 RepID=UPI0019D5808B|nr:gamma-gliadin-like [Panicum virgatum]
MAPPGFALGSVSLRVSLAFLIVLSEVFGLAGFFPRGRPFVARFSSPQATTPSQKEETTPSPQLETPSLQAEKTPRPQAETPSPQEEMIPSPQEMIPSPQEEIPSPQEMIPSPQEEMIPSPQEETTPWPQIVPLSSDKPFFTIVLSKGHVEKPAQLVCIEEIPSRLHSHLPGSRAPAVLLFGNQSWE